MSLKPVPVERFGGLNLRDDPREVGWSGAVDLLNVDLDRLGRVRQRDGFSDFTALAASDRYYDIFSAHDYKVIAMRRDGVATVEAIDEAGIVVATAATTSSAEVTSAVKFGTPSTSATYLGTSGITIMKYASGAFSSPTATVDGVAARTMPTARWVGVVPASNRLVAANASGGPGAAASSSSHVWFSDPGNAESWSTDNYVELTPGDGEGITAVVSWRELVFVFKPSRFFVFSGESTDRTGGVIFDYRPVDTGVGVSSVGAVTVGADGVYMLHASGIYRTTGGPPVRISDAVEPIFTGVGASAYYQGGVWSADHFPVGRICYHDERLFFSFGKTGSSTRDRLLVYDLRDETWVLWDIPAYAMLSHVSANKRIKFLFSYATGTNDIGFLDPSATSDAGTAIDSRYRTGFADLGTPGAEKIVREVLLDGIGSVGVSMITNDSATVPSATTVTLGTSPATGNGRYRVSSRGRNFSLQFADVSGGAWTVNQAVGHVRGERPPGLKSA